MVHENTHPGKNVPFSVNARSEKNAIRCGVLRLRRRVAFHSKTAMASISTRAPMGSAPAAKAPRAGASSGKKSPERHTVNLRCLREAGRTVGAVDGREIIDVGHHDGRLDHIGHRRPRSLEDLLHIRQRLSRLLDRAGLRHELRLGLLPSTDRQTFNRRRSGKGGGVR